MPDWEFGIRLGANWKGFDMNMFFKSAIGFDIFNFSQRSDVSATNRHAWVLDRWHGEGTSNFIPHIHRESHTAMQQGISSFYLRDASYLRLKNIQIGYNVPAKYTQKVFLQGLRVYVSGDNLLTFTKFFDGSLDPERTGTSNTGTGAPIYPQARIYSFGLKVTF